MAGPDTDAAAFWNGPMTRAWASEHACIDALFAGVLDLALAAAAPRPGERVIDIGCGSGTSLLALAERVGPSGRVLGLDLARESVAVAQRRIAAAGLRQAAAEIADAGAHPLPAAGFDLLFSRFGVMFFAEPVAAFRHLRAALRPGGRFCAAAFRAPEANPWTSAPAAAIRGLVPPQPPPPPPDAPGQFGWARAERVRGILEGAGFAAVQVTPRDLGFRLGADPAAAARTAMTFGAVSRALFEADAATRATAQMGLETFFAAHQGAEGVVMPAAIWIVTAAA
ncbi:class I SAM-dependent methyltransferase [Roseicella frigidaeris]|uniref:SAM-dependent methyltransferase n=1 Tax=Roseicella frigidaeris TaxID=2230885 RepID=A0A327LYW0_9PROT|nr:class I SAM-dependent methyltransferase [Roseicella frigidaeris]RAI56121.1 SAM-dependent methyltransferase [Roseicella frigidaeris]